MSSFTRSTLPRKCSSVLLTPDSNPNPNLNSTPITNDAMSGLGKMLEKLAYDRDVNK